MRPHHERQAREERVIFERFARASERATDDIRIRTDSIRQSAPDIECELESGEHVTFELVTIDSEESSRRTSHFGTTWSAWDRAIAALPADRQEVLRRRFCDAAVFVQFAGEPAAREMMRRFAELLDRLLQKPADFSGALYSHNPRATDVVQANVSRCAFADGPNLGGLSPGTLQPVDWARIQDKLLAKRYQVAGRFELLAYALRDRVLARVDEVVPELQIYGWLQGSPFARVWVFDWEKGLISRVERDWHRG
jgi:hypothetical protein